MAKKDENKLAYLQMPLPEGSKRKRMIRLNWGGLNKRQTSDTGELTAEKNISTLKYPHLTPSPKWEKMTFSAFGSLTVPTKINSDIICGYDRELVTYEKMDASGSSAKKYCLNFYQAGESTLNLMYSVDVTDTIPNKLYSEHTMLRTITRNADGSGSASEEYYLYPESIKVGVSRNQVNNIITESWQGAVSAPCHFENITAHLGRLFGTFKSNIYASNFNKFSNWTYDTADETSAANAWASTTQANPKAGSNFTGIASYNNHVVCFKEDFMHEIYNTQNPFRITDVYADGTINGRSIQEVGGMLIFVSGTGIKAYTGSKPKELGYKLSLDKIRDAVSGTDGRMYYLYCTLPDNTHKLFVYDSLVGEWSEEYFSEGEIISFTKAKNGIYALTSEGQVYRRTNSDYTHMWSFETDFIMSRSIDIKRVKKMQLYADIPSGSYIKVYMLKNGESFNADTSSLVYDSTGKSGLLPIRVLTRGTAAYGFKLHFEGYGYAEIYEIEIDTEDGGEAYV